MMNDHNIKTTRKKAQTNAQVQALEAAQKTRVIKKKRDTRRNILSGAYSW